MRCLQRLLGLFRMPEPDLRVATGLSWTEAEMWRVLLANQGVVAMIQTTSGLDAGRLFGQSGFNDFELRVRERDVVRAEQILGNRLDRGR